MIPDILVPFKHYDEETIAGVIDGVVGPDDEDSENAPCEATMNRWHHWMMMNRFDVEGQLKSIGYRLLGFGEELLKSGSSLLDQMRRSIPGEWFKKMLRCIYNSGGVLRPFYG